MKTKFLWIALLISVGLIVSLFVVFLISSPIEDVCFLGSYFLLTGVFGELCFTYSIAEKNYNYKLSKFMNFLMIIVIITWFVVPVLLKVLTEDLLIHTPIFILPGFFITRFFSLKFIYKLRYKRSFLGRMKIV